MNSNRYETFRRLFQNGSIKPNELKYLEEKHIITNEEYEEILKEGRQKKETIEKVDYTCKFWDGASDVITPAGTFKAEEFKRLHNIKEPTETILFLLDDVTHMITNLNTARGNYRLPRSLTNDEVLEFVMNAQNEELNAISPYVEDTQTAISILSEIKRTDELTEIKSLLLKILECVKGVN